MIPFVQRTSLLYVHDYFLLSQIMGFKNLKRDFRFIRFISLNESRLKDFRLISRLIVKEESRRDL